MRIFVVWLLKRVARTRRIPKGKPSIFMSKQRSSIRSLRSRGRDFLARTGFFTLSARDQPLLGATRRNGRWRGRRNCKPDSPETQLALGYYQYWVLRDYRLAENDVWASSKMLPGSSEVLWALGIIARREGKWDAKHCLLRRSSRLGSTERGVSGHSGRDLRQASTIPGRTKALRSGAGHYAQTFRI